MGDLAYKTYQVRAYMNSAGHDFLNMLFYKCSELYNERLSAWETAYEIDGESLKYFDHQSWFAEHRNSADFWGSISQEVGRGVLRRLDRACVAYYRRVKAGETPGYPRFKKPYQWNTIEIPSARPSMVKISQVWLCNQN